ncbi:unnamed protein product [Closterium sp. NIES-64]|nr:unnamed protein product [Closterium sp. NIES-65]CAI5988835.1 unnamed protein product [Closterium sp. NIES-65]CAI5992149.1 unnamed protein product [Closterium sp. NIES-64]
MRGGTDLELQAQEAAGGQEAPHPLSTSLHPSPISFLRSRLPLPLLSASPFPQVLVVEDDIVNCTISRQLLELLSCRVTLTRNGRDALDLMRGGTDLELQAQEAAVAAAGGAEEGAEVAPQFDLVLMDLNMPVMDGIKAVEQFREWEELAEPRRQATLIFAVTANVSDGNMVKCAQKGFDEFLSKPLTPEKLLNRLREVCRRQTIHRAL